MDARSNLLHPIAAAVLFAALPLLGGCVAETPDDLASEADMLESPEPVDQVDQGVSNSTVAQAADASCTTTSVKGLSKQIIAEARCMDADSFVAVTATSNAAFGSAVFAYLEKPARDKLVAALKANPGKSMTVNSMLRTIAQQYLLYRWYQGGRCGIGLAAKPGTSNHETGLAIDVSQWSTWKPILQNAGFHWLGSGDPVHFDYAGSGAKSYKGLDVKAFQRLWNRNHPSDTIAADGEWGPQTEARMKKAPASGFAKGATCGQPIEIGGPDEETRAPSLDLEDTDGFIPLDIENGELEHEEESCSDSAL